MMADGYNAKRRGERFQNSPSNPTAAYQRSLSTATQLIHAGRYLWYHIVKDWMYIIVVAQKNRDAYCAQIINIS